jgi:hypothetical protein
MRWLRLLPCLLLAACDQGTVLLEVGDAPVDDADRVVVQFTGVVLERSDGDHETTDFAAPLAIDLAAQVEGATTPLLDAVGATEGEYTGVRLKVSASGDGSDSFVETGGVAQGLVLDDADQPLLRVTRRFDVERLTQTRLVIDFDLRKSIHNPGSTGAPYRLRPSLRLVDPQTVGAISGTVAAALATASGCRPAVYVYTGHNASADDEGSALPPYASAIVRAAGSDFFYRVPFLPPGNYTAAFTCGAGGDDPAQDDTVSFAQSKNVTVSQGQDAAANFL